MAKNIEDQDFNQFVESVAGIKTDKSRLTELLGEIKKALAYNVHQQTNYSVLVIKGIRLDPKLFTDRVKNTADTIQLLQREQKYVEGLLATL